MTTGSIYNPDLYGGNGAINTQPMDTSGVASYTPQPYTPIAYNQAAENKYTQAFYNPMRSETSRIAREAMVRAGVSGNPILARYGSGDMMQRAGESLGKSYSAAKGIAMNKAGQEQNIAEMGNRIGYEALVNAGMAAAAAKNAAELAARNRSSARAMQRESLASAESQAQANREFQAAQAELQRQYGFETLDKQQGYGLESMEKQHGYNIDTLKFQEQARLSGLKDQADIDQASRAYELALTGFWNNWLKTATPEEQEQFRYVTPGTQPSEVIPTYTPIGVNAGPSPGIRSWTPYA